MLDYAATANWLVSLIESRFINETGLLSRTFPPSARTIFDNLDDVAPFLLHYGRQDFLLEQTRKLDESAFENLLPIGNILYAYKIDEYLGGLNAIYRATGDEHCKHLLIDAAHKCLSYFFGPNEHFAEFYDLRTKKPAKHFSPWAAGLLETFLEITDLVPELHGVPESVMQRWLSHPYVKNTGLFPFRASFSANGEMVNGISARLGMWCKEAPAITDFGQYPSDPGFKAMLKRNPLIYGLRRMNYAFRSGHWSQLMKSNTTPAFTMIALYARSKDVIWKTALEHWVLGVHEHMVQTEGVQGMYYPGNKRLETSLVDSFIFIDVLCDMYFHVTQDKTLLETATEIAEACLKWRWSNGLMPMSPKNARDHLDGQVDFSIALRRVGELANRRDLKDVSKDIMETTFNLHRSQDGLSTHVDEHGAVIPLPVNTIDPKYNGLALKGLIHLQSFDQNIYENPFLMDLFKDR